MEVILRELRGRLEEVDDLSAASSLLHWDQATYMPPGGAAARGRQMGTLQRLAHEKFTDPAVGRLLDALEPWAAGLPYDSDEAALIRATRRDFEKAIKVPAEFESRLCDHTATTYQVWTEARPANDFARVRPLLERTLELSRELAEFFPGYEHIADPLIDFSDYGMKARTVRELFGRLRAQLVPLVDAIGARPPLDDSCLHGSFPEAAQLEFGSGVARDFGYDFARGRQDKTHHPFMTKFSLGDVRITTRVKQSDLGEALFSTLHETGHALYEQGIDQGFEATPLADGASSGVHESQSRLWENLVGRSRGFWSHYYPSLQSTFLGQLGRIDIDTFYRAINKVERSLIRTDADEVTYNLHVMIRFDLELELLEGQLTVRDLPEAWRARYQSDLGVAPPDDRDGVLQDVHWYGGTIGGAFQGYTIGNILAAQIFESAVAAYPTIPTEITRGQFATLLGWLRDNLYRHGSKFTPTELIEKATDSPLRIEPYVNYLRTKYGELYSL